MKLKTGLLKLFTFNLYIYSTNKKQENSYIKYKLCEELFLKGSTGIRIKFFLTSFFYFLYSFLRYSKTSTKKVLFHFLGLKLDKLPLRVSWISQLVKKTGNFFTQVWMPGIVTNFNIARWSISKYSIPSIFYTEVGLIILAAPLIPVLRESRNQYVPAIVLSYSFPGVILSTNDFSYLFASFFYSIWFLAVGYTISDSPK